MNNNITLNKAQYIDGENVILTILLDKIVFKYININVYKLSKKIDAKYHYELINNSDNKRELVITIEALPIGNYGVEAILASDIYETAFDVVSSRSDFIRYGFLSDFSAEDKDLSDVNYINRLHLNAVQFYDWMYKHEELVSKQDVYTDPLGRITDLNVIKMKINKCIKLGIRPFAYGAVYAASKTLFEEHPEWGLYTIDKRPITFFDWLNFMNVSSSCGWSDFIINQFSKAMKELNFQGIHMDTYGFPKVVCDINGNQFSLKDEFPSLINRTSVEAKNINPENGVIFNCVNNWPVEKVADTYQDAVYIEVWPPHDTYYDLYNLIRKAKALGDKTVILAAYLNPFQGALTKAETHAAENALLLTYAAINAAGGTQLVHGENAGILCNSYYAKYASSSEKFKDKIINYADYIVRYADLLCKDKGIDVSMTSSYGINEDVCFHSEEAIFSPKGENNKVWTIIRESEDKMTIQLINLLSNDSLWNTPKNTYKEISDIRISIKTNSKVKGIYCASPDHIMKAASLDYEIKQIDRGIEYIFKIPNLKIWSTVWIETE